MSDLFCYGIHLETRRHMYEQWCDGVNKSDLERRYLNRPQSHGKLLTSLVRRHLGIETEKRSDLAAEQDELARLRALLRQHHIDPSTGRTTQ